MGLPAEKMRLSAECYTRIGENEWRLTEARGADSVINLAALDSSLPLAGLYHDLPDETGVSIPDAEAER